jgi:hypothetical protein
VARKYSSTKLCKLLWLIANCSLVVLFFLSGYYHFGEAPSLSWPVNVAIAVITPLAFLGGVNLFTGRPADAPSFSGSVFAHSGFFQLTFIAAIANIAFGVGELVSELPEIHFSSNTAKIFVAGVIMLAECTVFTKFEIGVRKLDSRGDAPTT